MDTYDAGGNVNLSIHSRWQFGDKPNSYSTRRNLSFENKHEVCKGCATTCATQMCSYKDIHHSNHGGKNKDVNVHWWGIRKLCSIHTGGIMKLL